MDYAVKPGKRGLFQVRICATDKFLSRNVDLQPLGQIQELHVGVSSVTPASDKATQRNEELLQI